MIAGTNQKAAPTSISTITSPAPLRASRPVLAAKNLTELIMPRFAEIWISARPANQASVYLSFGAASAPTLLIGVKASWRFCRSIASKKPPTPPNWARQKTVRTTVSGIMISPWTKSVAITAHEPPVTL